MRQYWKKFAKRFDALEERQRVLALVGSLIGLILLFYTLGYEPVSAQKKRLTREVADARKILAAMPKAPAQGTVDPDASKRSQRDGLRSQLAELDRIMTKVQSGLVPPERTAKLLEEMLSRGQGLHLVSLRTLPVQRFEAKGAKPGGEDADRTIYQHGFEITVQGSYGELHNFLARLEELPWQMFWGRLTVNADDYPVLKVTLTVQTLSLSKAWLIV